MNLQQLNAIIEENNKKLEQLSKLIDIQKSVSFWNGFCIGVTVVVLFIAMVIYGLI